MPKNLLQQKLGFNVNLTPSLKNSIGLLTMPYDDLLVEINNALEKNILLVENTEKIGGYSLNYEKTNEDIFAKLAHKESMFANLENQLPNIGLTAGQLSIAHIMVENLTEVGFLEVGIETIMRVYLKKQPKNKINLQQCEQVRRQMQINIEPFGIASFNMQDFFLLQINHNKNIADKPLIVKLLLGDVDINQVTSAQKDNFLSVVKLLAKTPTDNLDNSRNPYVQPDIFIEKTENDWRIHLKKLPDITINKKYLSLRTQIPDKTLFNEHLAVARGLIGSLAYRNQYLQQIAKALVAKQQQALTKGLAYLLPLTQKQLAFELGMGESTLSRLIKDKYMNTPIGVISIQDLFSANVGKHASKSIQHKIIQIIRNENKALSDQKICDLLTQDKVDICRRTVTKYRKKLNIPNARDRKYFKRPLHKYE